MTEDATDRFAVVAATQAALVVTLFALVSSIHPQVANSLVRTEPAITGSTYLLIERLLLPAFAVALAAPLLLVLVEYSAESESPPRRVLRTTATAFGSALLTLPVVGAVLLTVGVAESVTASRWAIAIPLFAVAVAVVGLGAKPRWRSGVCPELPLALALAGPAALLYSSGLVDDGFRPAGLLIAIVVIALVGALVRSHRSIDGARSTALFAAALLGLPVILLVLARLLAVGAFGASWYPIVSLLAATLPVLAVGVLAATRPDAARTAVHGLAIVCGVLVLASAVAVVGPVQWDDAVTEYTPGIYPDRSYTTDIERVDAPNATNPAIVTVTYDGSGAVRADGLRFVGPDFADVPGADQTEPGPWQGETSGGGAFVEPGDSVTVGVEYSPCRVHLEQGDARGFRIC